MPLWTGQRGGREAGAARTAMGAEMLPEALTAGTVLASSTSTLYIEVPVADVAAVQRFTPFAPSVLHSESSSPPGEERKVETPLSKQSGSSKKPAETGASDFTRPG